MNLYLVRHGEPKPESEDPECPLSERGTESVRRLAARAAQSGVRMDQIRHSGKKRAEQTAALLAERLEPTHGVVAVEGLKPNDDARPVAAAIQAGRESVMLVGHLPSLGHIASLLLVGDPEGRFIPFEQAQMVCLAQEAGKWTYRWTTPPSLG